MKIYWYIMTGLILFVFLLAAVCGFILWVDFLDVDTAVRWFNAVNSVLAASKYLVSVIILVMVDYLIIRKQHLGVRKGVLLWIPFVAFVIFAIVHWGFVGDAYIHYMQRHELWTGGFSGAVIYMALSYPIAFGISLGNHLLVSLYQKKFPPKNF